MKKLIFLILMILPTIGISQELDSNASFLKSKYPTDYANTIRKHAVEEWGTDHQMIVYTINKQSDALYYLVQNFKSEHTQIIYDAIKEWSREGYEASNIQKFNSFNTLSIENMIKLHCDWSMVKYVYEKQVKAKAAY